MFVGFHVAAIYCSRINFITSDVYQVLPLLIAKKYCLQYWKRMDQYNWLYSPTMACMGSSLPIDTRFCSSALRLIIENGEDNYLRAVDILKWAYSDLNIDTLTHSIVKSGRGGLLMVLWAIFVHCQCPSMFHMQRLVFPFLHYNGIVYLNGWCVINYRYCSLHTPG